MAEGIVGGILVEDEQKSEAEAVAGAEAFAAAVAAIASRQDPEVARGTVEFLSEQSRLLRTQAQHLEDEHALRLSQLRGQRVAQILRITSQIGVALVILVICAGIAVMLHDAFTSHSVVIDSFDAPAALAPRGVTGTVLASDVLNELIRLQSTTRSQALNNEKRSLANDWSNDVKVDVPETGVSLGEISRLLKARFGHDLHIGGSLVETASGRLALTVGGDHLLPRTFTGGAGDLDTLTVDAAQYVYAQFEPTLWARYLVDTNRCPEAIAFIKSVYSGIYDQRRASLLNDWGNCSRPDHTGNDHSPAARRQALELYQEALKIDPDFVFAYVNEESLLHRSGDDEGAWRIGKAASTRMGQRADLVTDQLTGDFRPVLDYLTADAAATGGMGSFGSESTVPRIAGLEVSLHDPVAAELTLQTLPISVGDPVEDLRAQLARAETNEALGNASQAAAEAEAALSLIRAQPWIADAAMDPDACEIAAVTAATGHSDTADATLSLPFAAHHPDCVRFRGDILDRRGDWAGAQQAYAAAVSLAPDLPAGYYSWGVALTRRGNLAGALAKLQTANQRGPHWADPLKAWGDVLARQGQLKQALAKYDEALKYAPSWAALKQARETAAKAIH
jgi:tetratricopeptide (TPR) repeat protein